jgi:hypothetical protein
MQNKQLNFTHLSCPTRPSIMPITLQWPRGECEVVEFTIAGQSFFGISAGHKHWHQSVHFLYDQF